MKARKVIKIDETKCNGCGVCIPNCHEGALQIINGKARLVNDSLCDGLGACIGHCPQGAITFEEAGAKAHSGMPGCPGAKVMDFSNNKKDSGEEPGNRQSQLRQWPVQLHLVPPAAPYFQKADVLLSADCVAYALADFHKNYLKGKSLAIACPKLDEGLDVYEEKIKALIDDANINTLTVMTMQVPCCQGLVAIAQQAAKSASRKIPVKSIVISLSGDVLKEEWL